MTKKEALKDLEEHVITSISSKERQHININVAKRVVSELCKTQEVLATSKSTTCKWKENEYDVYDTQCQKSFQITDDGDIKEHKFKYCVYCGGEIKVVR